MSNFTALEVVIGLAFVYFVLALVCSAVAETVSSLTKRRPKLLVKGIENLLGGSETITTEGKELALELWNHPLLQALIRPKTGTPVAASATEIPKDGKGPSYIPARTFVSALIDLGAQNTPAAKAKPAGKQRDKVVVATGLLDAIQAIPSEPVRRALLAVYRDAEGDAEAFRRGAEKWYEDAMDRVTGWYKRHIQVVLWVIAIVVVVLMNVDTLQIATTLWRDPVTRAAVTARAEKAVQQGKDSVEIRKTVSSLEIPFGWKLERGNGPQQIPNDPLAIVAKLIGLLLTAAALSLGAPFWFDLLSKFMSVRGTGPPPARASDGTAT